MKLKIKGREGTLYNAFTLSYETRWVVHAAMRNAKKSICGREVVKVSANQFDSEAEGSCVKCLDQIRIAERKHPGWE